jgi:hypothetical protein
MNYRALMSIVAAGESEQAEFERSVGIEAASAAHHDMIALSL